MRRGGAEIAETERRLNRFWDYNALYSIHENRAQGVAGLQFHDYLSRNDEINSRFSNRLALVHNRNGHLTLIKNAPQIELMARRLLIMLFGQPWTTLAMHFDTCSDDRLRQSI